MILNLPTRIPIPVPRAIKTWQTHCSNAWRVERVEKKNNMIDGMKIEHAYLAAQIEERD